MILSEILKYFPFFSIFFPSVLEIHDPWSMILKISIFGRNIHQWQSCNLINLSSLDTTNLKSIKLLQSPSQRVWYLSWNCILNININAIRKQPNMGFHFRILKFDKIPFCMKDLFKQNLHKLWNNQHISGCTEEENNKNRPGIWGDKD